LAQTLTIGSRGSKLALTQSHMVRDLLQKRHADLKIKLEIIQTTGDTTPGSLRNFGGQGVFTGEIERALLDGRIDLAVHSLKDLPTQFHADLMLVAAPLREDVRDVLITRQGCGLNALPANTRLGTGSLRRQAQLLALRPDLRFADIRGNLDTRISKVKEGQYDGIVLAAAGLHRLGWTEQISAYLETRQVLPAVGQAALGLQMRRQDPNASFVEAINHGPTFAAITAERSLLAHLGGGCQAPIAAWARQREGQIDLDGLVAHPDGTKLLRAWASAPPEQAEHLGAALADDLRGQGADAILEEAGVAP
jgi:hydroxymethylbilane synthase